MSAVSSYKDLTVWQKSVACTVHVYEMTRKFPKEELYGITSQIQRAATSIPANIAEGSTRGYLNQYINFLSVAYGSGAELETFLVIAKRLGYITERDRAVVEVELNEVMRMLNSLIRILKGKRLVPKH